MKRAAIVCMAIIWMCGACQGDTQHAHQDMRDGGSTTRDAATSGDAVGDADTPRDVGQDVADAGMSDAAQNAGDTRRVDGINFDGPRQAAAPSTGSNYAMDFPDDAGAGDAGTGATIGSPCTTGNDCTALGPHAACFHSDNGGFCTIDCNDDPEGPSELCPDGSLCFFGLRQDGGRLCLKSCSAQADCDPDNTGMQCSGRLGQMNVAPIAQPVCLPSCTTNADCNTDQSSMLCDPNTQRCENVDQALGSACTSNDDCKVLGAGGTCLKDSRNPDSGYCTVACDPNADNPCPLPGNYSPICLSDYASDTDGAPVPVCMLGCSSEDDCQQASTNTCNYVPPLHRALCTIACTSDADCIDGTCNTETGDCQSAYWSPNCHSNSECEGDLCVADMWKKEHFNCSQRCDTDADCPTDSVCVSAPAAIDGAGVHFVQDGSSGGFCAPSCTTVGDACDDPSATCIAPNAHPSIDFPASGNASSNFCWR